MGEFSLIHEIRERCAIARNDVRVGIGDDGAVLTVPYGQELVVSTDTLVAGVHFPLNTSAQDIGWKALAVNLSDLAAMGAVPAWATLALTLPTADGDWVRCFADGFAQLARHYQLALVGGDTTQGPLTITVTVHGFVPTGQALLRSGANVGDTVWVTGTLGDAAAGLQIATKPGKGQTPNAAAAGLMKRLNRPDPRIKAGLALRDIATAAIDISDGLLADLGHICAQSDVGAELNIEALPSSKALRALFDPDSRWRLQLAGGDDYELCFTVPSEKATALVQDLIDLDCGVTCIGRITSGSGVRVNKPDGSELILPHRGFEHFAV